MKAQTAHRRWPFLILLQSTPLYIIYVAVYVLGVVKSRIYGIGVIVLPVAIWLLRRLIWYLTAFRVNKAKAKLDKLVEKRKLLVEDYKKKTNYENIRKLIEGDEPQQSPEVNKSGKNNDPATRAFDGKNEPRMAGKLPKDTNRESIPIYHSSWVDRLLDIAIGDAQSPLGRYALICSNCMAHNGLAPQGKQAEEISYVCPVCSVHNGPEFSLDGVNLEENRYTDEVVDEGTVSNQGEQVTDHSGEDSRDAQAPIENSEVNSSTSEDPENSESTPGTE